MKKLAVILSIVFLPYGLLFSQISGDGTESNPYYGTISSNTTWYPDSYSDHTIYTNSIEITSGATLTISPGTYEGGLVQFSSGYTLTIGNGCGFIIEPMTAVSVDNIINNGTLRLESSSNEGGVASLIHNSYSGSGTTEVKLYLSGGTSPYGDYKWHYVSVPVAGVTATTFSTLNLAQYLESLVTGADNYPGWVAYDGYQYSSGSTLGYTFSTLTVGKGYDYYSASGNTFTFTGEINTTDNTPSVTCGSGYPDYQGYNLLGNPFASCLEWDSIVVNDLPANINDAIYFTSNGSMASYVNGIGDNGGSGTIPPLQGFFVKATGSSTVTLSADARTHNLDQMRYKKKSTKGSVNDTISFVRLKMSNSIDSTDLVVRFNSNATSGVDKMYDAYEFSKTTGDINIWTTVDDVSYSINGLPFPETAIEIPVGVNSKTEGTFRLSSEEINLLDNYSVVLKDITTNNAADLKKGESIDFTISGLAEDRFILVITKSATDIPVTEVSNEKFNIYYGSGYINICALTNDFDNATGTITIYDITGKKVYQQNDTEWYNKGDIKQISLGNSCNGIYVVEIKINSERYTEKVFVH